MSTLTRRIAPHARASWIAFFAVAVLAMVVAIVVVVLAGGGRTGGVVTAATWFVAVVFLGACLDAILVPGNPDVRRHAGHDAGWTGLGAAVSLPEGGSAGGDAGSCG